jgi:hypothetical protein
LFNLAEDATVDAAIRSLETWGPAFSSSGFGGFEAVLQELCLEEKEAS